MNHLSISTVKIRRVICDNNKNGRYNLNLSLKR